MIELLAIAAILQLQFAAAGDMASCSSIVNLEPSGMHEIAQVVFEDHLAESCSKELNLDAIRKLFAPADSGELLAFTQQSFCFKLNNGTKVGCNSAKQSHLASTTKLVTSEFMMQMSPKLEVGTDACLVNGTLSLIDHENAYFGETDLVKVLKEVRASKDSKKIKRVCVSDEFLFEAQGCQPYGKWIDNIGSHTLFPQVQTCTLVNLKNSFARKDIKFVRGPNCACKKEVKKIRTPVADQLQTMLAISDSYQFDRIIKNRGLTEQFQQYAMKTYGLSLKDPTGSGDFNQANCESFIDLNILKKCDINILPDGDTPGVTWKSRADESYRDDVCAKTGSKPSRGTANFVGCFKKESSPIRTFGMFYEGDPCTTLSQLAPVRSIQNRLINLMLKTPSDLFIPPP